MIEKSINDTLEVNTEDYPREMELKRDREHKYARFDEISALKDEIIKKLLLNQKEEIVNLKKNMEKKY